MTYKTMENKRAGARAFGIIFQWLALITIIGTLIAANIVAHESASLGISSNHDSVIWAIATSGLFASCILAALGYVLGILCAIYDRQNPVNPPPK